MITGRIWDPVIVALLFAILADAKPTPLPRSSNLIYSQPGVVAVYIRSGNTPLKDINQDLAEAFDFNAVKHGRLAFGRQINKILREKENNPNALNSNGLAEGESYTLKKRQIGKKNAQSEENEDTHIQKIPKQ